MAHRSAQEKLFWDLLPQLDIPQDGELRARLARAWSRAAQTEHASIASFARFSLELCALGAPPELLERAHQAAIDEVAHARVSFALASAYGGKPLGPGALALDDVSFDFNLLSTLKGTIVDGCISESVAAREAEVGASECRDPTVRAALELITLDETRHAELAWSTVAWILQGVDAPTKKKARSYFDEALSLPPVPPTDPQEAELLRHGVLTSSRRRALRSEVLDKLIAPAIAALPL